MTNEENGNMGISVYQRMLCRYAGIFILCFCFSSVSSQCLPASCLPTTLPTNQPTPAAHLGYLPTCTYLPSYLPAYTNLFVFVSLFPPFLLFTKLQVSMIRKYHIHTLQTNPCFREEKSQSQKSHRNKTSKRQSKAFNALFPIKMIAKLEEHKVLKNKTKTKHRTPTKMGATDNKRTTTLERTAALATAGGGGGG